MTNNQESNGANRPTGRESADASSAERLADLQRAVTLLRQARSLRGEAALAEFQARALLERIAYPDAPQLRESSTREGQRRGQGLHGEDSEAAKEVVVRELTRLRESDGW